LGFFEVSVAPCGAVWRRLDAGVQRENRSRALHEIPLETSGHRTPTVRYGRVSKVGIPALSPGNNEVNEESR
jgi:hypothetical protein